MATKWLTRVHEINGTTSFCVVWRRLWGRCVTWNWWQKKQKPGHLNIMSGWINEVNRTDNDWLSAHTQGFRGNTWYDAEDNGQHQEFGKRNIVVLILINSICKKNTPQLYFFVLLYPNMFLKTKVFLRRRGTTNFNRWYCEIQPSIFSF